ncbi:MAG: NAD(P)H-hydrate dehydratase, partial [Oscillospiraceae bacterium]|nr:NAD(P)H-hydrate dehydratase [Oscillospiraceae bacterium]
SACCPLVIDADGLNLMAEDSSWRKLITTPAILTPHIGEFSQLSSTPIEEIHMNRSDSARRYAQAEGVYLILKSDQTVVATPEGDAYLNTAGNSGLAKAGSGDLLAGIVAGLLAMGYPPKESALAGVYIHSLAADIAAEYRNLHSLTASYIALYISDAYDVILSSSS